MNNVTVYKFDLRDAFNGAIFLCEKKYILAEGKICGKLNIMSENEYYEYRFKITCVKREISSIKMRKAIKVTTWKKCYGCHKKLEIMIIFTH